MDEHITIHFERSGGFAGMSRRLKIDSNDLSQSEADELQAILEKSDLAGAQQHVAPASNMPDRFSYNLIIEKADKKYEMTFGESSVPAGIQPLFQYLNMKLRSVR